MKTKSRSSRIDASWSSRFMCSSGGGRFDGGIWDAKGGIDILEANGAVVGGISVASGFHGAVPRSNILESRASLALFLPCLKFSTCGLSRAMGLCKLSMCVGAVPRGVPRPPPLATFGLAFFSRFGLLVRRPVMVVSVMWVRSVVRFSPIMLPPVPARFAVRREPVGTAVGCGCDGGGAVRSVLLRGRVVVSRAVPRREDSGG